MNDSVIKEFQSRIEAFTNQFLAHYSPTPFRDDSHKKKVIHDPVWGSNRFHAWEIAILDSPLLQRLRRVKQVGMAHLVYPTANHTRFDHTLGVMSLVSRISAALNVNAEEGAGDIVPKTDEYNLRMAAALHDVGHCLYSHVGERIYSQRPEFQVIKKFYYKEFNVDPKPHEIMSHLIVTSKAFKEFFNGVMNNEQLTPSDVKKQFNIDFVANAIIGYWKDRPQDRHKVEIINGPLDADKLDYLARDAYFAGLSVDYDINRYMVTVNYYEEDFETVGQTSTSKKSLALKLPLSGLTALEQIVISKMMLYSYLYHHQKVLAAEAMLVTVFENFQKGGITELDGISISHPTDFLSLTDDVIERLLNVERNRAFETGSVSALDIALMLSRRLLVKRALVLSRLFIKDLENEEDHEKQNAAILGFSNLKSDLSDPQRKNEFRQELHQRVKAKLSDDRKHTFDERLIVIDLPKLPDVKEVINIVVPTEDEGGRVTELKKLFPLKEWAESYGAVQWKGYIYTMPGYRQEVCEAATKLIQEKYGIQISEEAMRYCAIPKIDREAKPPETQGRQLAFGLKP